MNNPTSINQYHEPTLEERLLFRAWILGEITVDELFVGLRNAQRDAVLPPTTALPDAEAS